MFENLNNSGGSTNNLNSNNTQTPSKQPEVDDIFAETDGVPESSQNNQEFNKKSEIVTNRVGLGANSNPSILDEEEDDEKKGGKIFKIIVIVMVVLIIGLLGFLVYNKFFQGDKNVADTGVVTDNNIATGTDNVVTDNNVNDVNNGAIEKTDEFTDFIPLTPGDVETSTDMTGGESTPQEETGDATPTVPVDSDSDGLPDSEELIYGTNPLLLDTDGDGVSDYEEIKIYTSDPLNPDTDGDGYLDGEEISNGYNPNGDGMLSDI